MGSEVVISSGYTLLTAVERAFVDQTVRTFCAIAERERVRPQDVLERPIDPRLLGEHGPELIARHGVQAAIVECIRDVGMVGAITLDGVLTELWSIVHSNIEDYFIQWDDGRRDDIDVSRVPRVKLAAVRQYEVEIFPDGRVKKKLAFWPKIDAIKTALELLDRLPASHHLKSLNPRATPQSATLPNDITIERAAERYAVAALSNGVT